MSAGILQRPIIGGVFGSGTYALASVAGVASGLHAVKYLVINPRTGAVVSAAPEKTEALAAARRVIRATDALVRYGSTAANDPMPVQAELWPEDVRAVPARQAKAQRVTRRRREVFDRSEGLCHYCGTTLTLDGSWHVEHMVPKALDGTDTPGNLVAACTACNLAKSDRTALEFVVLRGFGPAAAPGQ